MDLLILVGRVVGFDLNNDNKEKMNGVVSYK